jgi:hypothetical protein
MDVRPTVTEELAEIETVAQGKAICHHMFMDLRLEDNGMWMCQCGSIGTLAGDANRKLAFFPQRLTYNRSNIRREIKRTMKRYKGGKKLPKHI